MAIDHIFRMLGASAGGAPHFPPTELYNEGWLSRLVLAWFSSHPVPGHPLQFAPRATWFSEALLPSAFPPRVRGDSLGESRTHADGVIGHFRIGAAGNADLSLAPEASQLVVIEAKLLSSLAAGVSKAPDFDQAARNVACLVEVLSRAGRPASTMSKLGFCVLAPQAQLAKGNFVKLVTSESINVKVAKRVGAYQGEKDHWYHQWFQTAPPFIDLTLISWEEIIATIRDQDEQFANEIAEFYQLALKFCGLSPADQ